MLRKIHYLNANEDDSTAFAYVRSFSQHIYCIFVFLISHNSDQAWQIGKRLCLDMVV